MLEIEFLKRDIKKFGIEEFAKKFKPAFVKFMDAFKINTESRTRADWNKETKIGEDLAFSLYNSKEFAKKYAGVYRDMLSGFHTLLFNSREMKSLPSDMSEFKKLLEAYEVAYETRELWP